MDRYELGRFLANYGNVYGEDLEPDDSDLASADYLIDEILPDPTGIYFEQVSRDVHGYHLLFRRIVGTVLIGAVALVLILTHPWSAS